MTFNIHSAYRIIAAALQSAEAQDSLRTTTASIWIRATKDLPRSLAVPIRCYWLVIVDDQLHSNCKANAQHFLAAGTQRCRTAVARGTSVGRPVTERNMSASIRDVDGGHALLRDQHMTRFRCSLHRTTQEWKKH